MKTLILGLCAAAMVLFPLRAAAQPPMHDSPKVTISVMTPTVVGTTVLKAGDYRFQCKHVNGKSFLVVSEVGTGKELVRVPCEQDVLRDKNENSELRSFVGADGARALQSVRMKGETVAHRLVD